MSHCESCGKLKRGLCRYCQPQEYIDMMQQALMDLANEPLLKREWVGLTKEERHKISMDNRPYCADIMVAHEEELKRRNT
jgi:hypothetical protein